MPNVEFEQDVAMSRMRSESNHSQHVASSGGMAGWLIEKNILKSEDQAKKLLLIIVIVNFIIAGIIIAIFLMWYEKNTEK